MMTECTKRGDTLRVPVLHAFFGSREARKLGHGVQSCLPVIPTCLAALQLQKCLNMGKLGATRFDDGKRAKVAARQVHMRDTCKAISDDSHADTQARAQAVA